MIPSLFLKVKRKNKKMKIESWKRGANIFGTGAKLLAAGALLTFLAGEFCAWRVDVNQKKLKLK